MFTHAQVALRWRGLIRRAQIGAWDDSPLDGDHGHTLRAEADVTVDPALSVGQAHVLAHHAEQNLLADVRRLTGATIHISPSGAHTGSRVDADADALRARTNRHTHPSAPTAPLS